MRFSYGLIPLVLSACVLAGKGELSEPGEARPATNGSSEIIATDPDTVAIAKGEPQLIEFFAYW